MVESRLDSTIVTCCFIPDNTISKRRLQWPINLSASQYKSLFILTPQTFLNGWIYVFDPRLGLKNSLDFTILNLMMHFEKGNSFLCQLKPRFLHLGRKCRAWGSVFIAFLGAIKGTKFYAIISPSIKLFSRRHSPAPELERGSLRPSAWWGQLMCHGHHYDSVGSHRSLTVRGF